MMKRIILTITIALTLVGCISGPTQPFEAVAVDNNHAPAAKLECPVAGAKITFEQAVAIARHNNPTLESIRLAMVKAKAVEARLKAGRTPKLDVVGSAGRYSDGQRVLPASVNGEPGVFSKNLMGADLVLSYPLYTGGTLKANEESARFAASSSQLQYLRAQQEVEYRIACAFAQIFAQRRHIESLTFNRTTLTSHLALVNDLISAEKAIAVDRLRVEVRIADLQQNQMRADNNLQITMEVLANLMGLDSAQFEVVGELTSADAGRAPPDETALLLAAEQSRNDLAAMGEQMKAQAKRVDAARGAMMPQLSAFAAYGGRWGIDPNDEPAGADSADGRGSVGLFVTFPLWDGNLRRAAVDVEKAELASLQKKYAALKQGVMLEIRTAGLNLKSARERLTSTGKAVEQAREVLRTQQRAQGLGKATLTDVLDAQTALLTAQTNDYAALAEYQIAEAELKLAVGQEIEESP